MIAPRFLPVVGILLACALVPTLIHSYSGEVPPDGYSAVRISPMLAGYSSTASTRNATWGKRRFDSDDWVERNYTNGSRSVRLTVVRSYDPKSLYHHPELAISYGLRFSGTQIVRPAGRPDVPVHVLTPTVGETAAAAYALHYGGRFVEDPIRFQILTAGELLFSRRRPMTIFYAVESNPPNPPTPPSLTAFLVAAIDDFLAQKADAPSGQ